MVRQIARVLLDSPVPQLDRLFDYEVPDELADAVVVGVRVRVPLRSGNRKIDAYVIELAREADDSRTLSAIESLVSPVPLLPLASYELARAVATRAAGSAADVIRLIVPLRQVRVEKAWLAAVPPTPPDPAAINHDAIHETLDRYELPQAGAHPNKQVFEAIPLVRDRLPEWTRLLTALAALQLSEGRSSILAVPDYRDLDLLERALGAVIGQESVVRIDAQQPNADRYRAYLRMLAAADPEGAPCVVIGNRSAVYAPVRAGLVALWDDGDQLFDEPLAPYVHARDAALIRQSLEGSSLVFAGHTRSTDVERLVATGYLTAVTATRRVHPNVVLSAQETFERSGPRVTSAAFQAAREAVKHGPVLVQVARPGYAPTLVCAGCREPARCTGCGGPLATASRASVPSCAWCGKLATSWTCAHCQSHAYHLAGSGTERTADEFGRAFPGVRVVVSDGAHQVTEVPDKPVLVVATRGAEPIAPNGYSAVILLDGARMLQAADLRVGENCVRWWSNAAALAAGGAPIHLVGVEGAAPRAVATWNQAGYARHELTERAPLRMPPTCRVAAVEGQHDLVKAALDELKPLELGDTAILGPVALDSERVRALVRFDYARGGEVAHALRAEVISAAAKHRRGPGNNRLPLTTRFDILDPSL